MPRIRIFAFVALAALISLPLAAADSSKSGAKAKAKDLAAPAAVKPADHGPFGLGLVLGSVSGVSASYRTAPANYIQGSAAWNFVAPGGVTFTGDYVFRFDEALKLDGIAIPLYAGAGVKVGIAIGRESSNDFPLSFGFRIPLGVRWEFRQAPLELFLELVPGIRLLPKTDPDFDAGLGLRWYF